MKDLIRLLKIAHAVEIGAYQAYGGHMMSVPPGEERMAIWLIQCDELIHKHDCEQFLTFFGEKPNKFLDVSLFVIGKMIGQMCRISPRRASAFGAKVMEMMGADIYQRLADEAWDLGLKNLAWKFMIMSGTERRHEKFFKGLNDPKRTKVSAQQNRSLTYK